jgi:hypothetical protein
MWFEWIDAQDQAAMNADSSAFTSAASETSASLSRARFPGSLP